MIFDAGLIAALLAYVVLARLVLKVPLPWRMRLFAALNIATTGVAFYWALKPAWLFLAVYIAIVCIAWALVRGVAKREGAMSVLSISFPVVVLVLVKYLPGWHLLLPRLHAAPDPAHLATYFVGVSFMAFRLSHLAIQVRNGTATEPDLASYLAYAFFPPTMVVGPINPYSVHSESLAEREKDPAPLKNAFMRMVVGFVKYLFFSNVFNQWTYAGLLADGRRHGAVDWLVSLVAYYLYLYVNFSGFCDIAIGVAGLIGIRVEENFKNPFVARNIKDFWNRWHITLSLYMRDMVFTPLSKWVMRKATPKTRDHVVVVPIFTIFMLIGIWHGAGVNYLVFGFMHAVAVIANHYYVLFLKRVLGPARLKAYNQNRVIEVIAVCATFGYVCLSLAVFANSKGMDRTLQVIRSLLH